jgi:hypothetical protein
MLTISAVQYTMSEAITLIKAQPGAWVKSFPYYLLKINGSGLTTFASLPALILRLGTYVTDEPKNDQPRLARYRGNGPSLNSAMFLSPILATAVKLDDRVAVAALVATGDIDATAGVTNKSTHSSDPESGLPKGIGVAVSEFYINGAEGRRVTKRTEGLKTTYYYSDNHVANTYKYQRLI